MTSPVPHRRRPPQGSPLGDAMVWVSRITAVGLTMFLPGVVGGWLDQRLGLRFVGPAGFVLGFAAALTWLSRLAVRSERSP